MPDVQTPTLTIYDTARRAEVPFQPALPPLVQMYVCGPTVYDDAHLGHARAAVVFDTLYRVLRTICGYRVNYVRNYTDIEDKIINRAAENHEPWTDLIERYIQRYSEDMASLAVLPPTVTPRVTENIPQIVAYTQRLIDGGHAYAVEGSVYFDIKSFAEYGKLSGRDTAGLLAGQRVEVDLRKRDPLDFALWKAAKPGEPSWPAPWGAGRPGWHIECSVMSANYAAETLDIHGGGRDLIFPHHENEVAQSECVHHKPLARYWIHNGFVNVNAEKMSKSLRNFFTVRDILELCPREPVRHFLLSAQYRSPLDFTWPNMGESIKALERFYLLRQLIEPYLVAGDFNGSELASDLLAEITRKSRAEFITAILDDLNTPRAFGAVFQWVTDVNRLLDDNRKAKQREAWKGGWTAVQQWLAFLDDTVGVFGSKSAMFFDELNAKGLHLLKLDAATVKQRLTARESARAARDFATSDAVRAELIGLGLIVEDTAHGTQFRVDAGAVVERLAAL